jgi:ribosomal protein S18 acetylase RimI-like enzyme
MSVLNQDKASNSSPNPVRYSVKVANVADLNPLVEVLMSSFYPQTGCNRWLYPLIRLGLREDLKIRLMASTQRYVCLAAVCHDSRAATADHALVGTVEISLRSQFWHPFQPRRPYIANLAVQAQYRRQRIAQQLLATCEEVAHQWGFSSLCLHVKTKNDQALQLYQKMGYRCTAPSPRWLPSNRLLLVKDLKAL